ncbi:protein HID1-like isoform X3 [Syngnathoides biaculeatus]|uniref:protein HID1-like isoform X3 n=1 Tax=Syngnathoides biaculeatus TaxID=300417 RepID=UPI002ADE2059|nr:protein HID1-like isoform X3 [Syngnathoides biaculeatus]
MGSGDSKVHFRKAVIQLTSAAQPVEASDDGFWEQFWADPATSVQDIFALVPAAEIRALREESPSNLATLCYKAVEKLGRAALRGCPSERERAAVLNCARLLTRVLPFIYEDADWRGFFWSSLPGAQNQRRRHDDDADGGRPLAESLLLAVSDLLFCPDFSVRSRKRGGQEDVPVPVTYTETETETVDSCELIWEAGVGFAPSPPPNSVYDGNRAELLKLLLTCFSEVLYQPPGDHRANPWVLFFCSAANRHALPLFTSLLNVVCAYDPSGSGFPYDHLLLSDRRQILAEQALQVLVVSLEQPDVLRPSTASAEDETSVRNAAKVFLLLSGELKAVLTPSRPLQSGQNPENQFVNFLSRIHREEDLSFILKGLIRLLNNPLVQTYLPNSAKKISFHQELLLLFWKLCDFNKKFLYFVLKSSDVLDVLVPILFFLNEARADPSGVGLVHMGVFILLLLSGERNFGVRLNKPFAPRAPMDVPVFSGTHADLLLVIFHRMMTCGHRRLRPLFDCLLTVVVNVSPYLKSLSMVSANKLLHLLEVFSPPWFLFSAPRNHQLVFFLLEVFNNIIQYQFDGNSNLVYSLIRRRNLFQQLANLRADAASIRKALLYETEQKKKKKAGPSQSDTDDADSRSGPSWPGAPPGPGFSKIAQKSRVGHGGATAADPPPTAAHTEGENETETESKAATGLAGTPSAPGPWTASPDWVSSWKSKLPLQTIMRLLQVLVPQVEKICIDKALTDESEILKFLRRGTLVGLLPVPHPILIRKYQANAATSSWFRTYAWGVVYLRNLDPPIWYDTDIRLFDIQRI